MLYERLVNFIGGEEMYESKQRFCISPIAPKEVCFATASRFFGLHFEFQICSKVNTSGEAFRYEKQHFRFKSSARIELKVISLCVGQCLAR